MNLTSILIGLDSIHTVAIHCGNYPMTDCDDNEYEYDEDPVVLLSNAVDQASSLIKFLNNDKELMDLIQKKFDLAKSK